MTIEQVAYTLVAVLFGLTVALVNYIWRAKNAEHSSAIERIEKSQTSFEEKISEKFDEVISMIQTINSNPEKCNGKFATKSAMSNAWEKIEDHEKRIYLLEHGGGKNG